MFNWSWHVRQSFHYLYYFQLHLTLINNSGVENKIKEDIDSALMTVGMKREEKLVALKF
jgi:hypothetical protein